MKHEYDDIIIGLKSGSFEYIAFEKITSCIVASYTISL